MTHESHLSQDPSALGVPDAEVLDRILAGEASPDETARVHHWLAAHADAEALIQRFVLEVAGAAHPEHVDAAASYTALLRKLAGGQSTPNSSRPNPGATAPRSFGRILQPTGSLQSHAGWYTAAAVMLGVLVLVFGRYGGHSSSGMLMPMSTYMTAPGERATIKLPDGSTAALDVATRLDVPADYLTGNHTLHLTGEALFTVTHHDRAPFTVVSGNTTTRVLGTSFVVRHYTSDTNALVAVHDGRVAVGSPSGSFVLTNQQFVELSHHQHGVVHPADPSLFAFSTGTLVINAAGGMPLRDAIKELDRWYNVEIRLGDSTLATRPVKGEFSVESLADLAGILSWTLDVRVERNNRILTLYSRR